MNPNKMSVKIWGLRRLAMEWLGVTAMMEGVFFVMEGLRKRVDAIGSRADELTKRVDAVLGPLDGGEPKVQRVPGRIDFTTGTAGEMVNRIEAVKEQFEVLSQRMDAGSERVTAVSERLDAVTKRLDAVVGRHRLEGGEKPAPRPARKVPR